MKIVLNKFRTIFSLCTIAFSATFLFPSCVATEPRYDNILGTVCFVNLYESGKADYYDEIFSRLEQIDAEFSIDKYSSDIYRINSFAYERPVVVSEDVFNVIVMAQKVSEFTGGAFDISVEPLVSLWKLTSDTPHIALQSEIDELLPLVDYKNIILNPLEKSVKLAKPGMKLDMGGIAKGYAADEIVKICKNHKIKRAVIDLGGNVYVYGKKSRKSFWNVGIKNPELPDEAPLLKLAVPETSVVTSGIYERFFDVGQKRYHHILSPKTGYPIDNELASVTVISSNSMLADALSTAFFVLGTEKSCRLLPTLKQAFDSEISVVFINKNHTVSFSDDFPYSSTLLYESWDIK